MKRKIIISIAIVLLLLLGGYLWVNRILDKYEEDGRMTEQLSSRVLGPFEGNNHIDDYPVADSDITWGKDFLVLEDYDEGDYHIRYVSFWNDKLGSVQNLPGDLVKGIVVIRSGDEEIGEYETGSKYKNENTTPKKAYRRYSLIQYFDLDTEHILARDTIWGSMPPNSVGDAHSGHGNFPKNKDVIKSIKERLKL